MPTITKLDIRQTPSGKNIKVRVYLDGRYAFSLKPEAAIGLKLNQQLESCEITSLAIKNERLNCLAAASRYLFNRPHSEHELVQKLSRRFGENTINLILPDLKNRNLLNDPEFARYWSESREAFKPRSRRLTGLELRNKGVSPDVIEDATRSLDDSDSAYRAAARKAQLLKSADYDTFRRRVGEYLHRRGYDNEVIRRTVKTLWQENSI